MTQNENQSGLAARWLQGAKDLVWQDDPSVKKIPADASIVQPDQVTTKHVGVAAVEVTPLSDAMTDDLLNLVMNRPTAYSALQEAIAALAGIAMDEATRYRSAFAVLKKTQQRTVEQIAQAIEVHLGVLESEKIRFSGQSRNVEDDEITARMKDINSLKAAIEEGDQQIIKLNADTAALIKQIREDSAKKQARSDELVRETEQKKQAIASTTRNFEAATDSVKKTLDRERSKIQRYLE